MHTCRVKFDMHKNVQLDEFAGLKSNLGVPFLILTITVGTHNCKITPMQLLCTHDARIMIELIATELFV